MTRQQWAEARHKELAQQASAAAERFATAARAADECVSRLRAIEGAEHELDALEHLTEEWATEEAKRLRPDMEAERAAIAERLRGARATAETAQAEHLRLVGRKNVLAAVQAVGGEAEQADAP